MSDLGLTLQVLLKLREWRQHERWSRPQIEAYQATALRQMREYAYLHSRFYQQFHKGLFQCPLQELPILTKPMMMEHFDELVTDPTIHLEDVRGYVANDTNNQRFLNHFWVNATSGSSGHPGFFLFNRLEWLTIMASFARGQEWSGKSVSLTHRTKMASVASRSAWHLSSQVAATAKSWWIPTLRLAASEPLPEILRQLNEFQPEVLIAYASMARVLAEEQLANRLHIKPRFVYVSSEVLTDKTRRRVKLAWGDEPFNQYGSTETANVAAEYRKDRRLHVYDDLLIVETVDEDYQPVAPCAFGTKLLVTTLFSRTQPLIRYEMNDSVKLSAPGNDGELPFRIIEGIQGRTEDVLYLPGVAGGKIAIQPLVFNRVMDIVPASGWQVIQQVNNLTVLLSGVPEFFANEPLVNKLTEELTAQGVVIPQIWVQRVSVIPKTIAGKAPLIRAVIPTH
jgi:phenylacetate-coenzyme A ligase PaaK-like adenylate-forming protein